MCIAPHTFTPEAHEDALRKYKQRFASREAIFKALEKRIDFASPLWEYTDDGERWKRLMRQQSLDEKELGL